jgi:hypothetical protein
MTIRKPAGTALPAIFFVGLMALVALAVLSGPALAVEEDAPEEAPPPPDIEELCQEGTIAEEFCPDTYEEPAWFQWLIYPLLIVGLVMVTVMLVVYLTWQPRFAREAEEKKKSRR